MMRAALSVLGLCALSGAVSAAEPAHPDFTGVWSGVLTTRDDPYWQVEDHLCFLGCPASFRAHLGELLDDPANASQPAMALAGQGMGKMAADRAALSTPEGLARLAATETADLTTFCEPYGLVREAMNALPVAIRETAEGLIFDYEEWGLERTIYMDGRPRPADLAPTPLGFSIGRYEDGALVVETEGLSGDYYASIASPTARWGAYADGARVIERYTIEEDPRRLHLELTVIDPVTLTQPYVWTKTWLATPGVPLLEDSCQDVPGQF